MPLARHQHEALAQQALDRQVRPPEVAPEVRPPEVAPEVHRP